MNLPNNTIKILSVMVDNASSNNTMVTHMNELLAHFGGDTGQVRCVLHIMNLVIKSLLKPFDAPKKDAS